MKKILYCLLIFVASHHLHAESELRMRNLETRVNSLEKSKSANTPHYDPITPNAGPKVYDGMDMFLTTDFIYWTGRLDTLTYARSGSGNFLDVQNPEKGKMHSVDWGWDPGFKLGYGWTFARGGWDLFLQYTWFYTNVGDSVETNHLHPSFEILPPDLKSILSITPISMKKAHAHWGLHYQVGDLELGRNYYINRYLKLRPFIGLKGTWQKQDYNVFYETIPISFQESDLFFDFKTRQDQMLWGIGIRAGLNTSWQFTKWLSLYGDFALTGIWTHYNIDRKDSYTEIRDEVFLDQLERTTAYLDGSLEVIKPVFEFSLGLRAETYFHCNQFHVLLQCGWESQLWPSQTLFISLSENYDRFDLSLHGLTCKFRFDF